MVDRKKRRNVKHMSKYGVGDCTSLLEDMMKEKMPRQEKRRKVDNVLSEYGTEDYTEQNKSDRRKFNVTRVRIN